MVGVRVNYSKDETCGCYTFYPKEKTDIEGGLRTKGIYKNDTEECPLVTYITVVYNRADTIKRCMKSVLNQTYSNVEYIIIDGSSTDGTLQLIQEEAENIDYYISQPDSGIYNAMNKGISLARGRFLCFMNSDDECVLDAAEKVIAEYKRTGADIICGVRNLYQDGLQLKEYTYPRYCIKHSTFRYIQMYHQATYASSEVFNRIGGFNENYDLLSDWIWESAAIDSGATVDFCDIVLTNFNYDGASFKGIVKRDNEWIDWTMKTFPLLTQEDAELFVYSLDRERHPMFDVETLWRVAVKYEEDLNFQKAFYEDILMACIETCHDISLINCISESEVGNLLEKHGLRDSLDITSLSEVEKWLNKRLLESISITNDNIFEKKRNIIDVLIKVRQFQLDILLKIYRKNCSYVLDLNQKIQGWKRYFYYLNARWAGKDVRKSREYYIKMRDSWNID